MQPAIKAVSQPENEVFQPLSALGENNPQWAFQREPQKADGVLWPVLPVCVHHEHRIAQRPTEVYMNQPDGDCTLVTEVSS
jgi:hypothetical protein